MIPLSVNLPSSAAFQLLSFVSQAEQDAQMLRSQSSRLRQEVNQLQQQLYQDIQEIKQIDPSFSLIQQVEPISFEQIQALLCDRTALLEWYLLDDYFLVLIIVGHQSEVKVWTSTPEDLQSLKTWVVKYLQAYVQPSRQDWKESLEPLLNELTQMLHIKEILAYLPSHCDQLVMIPHRFLHLLPLHALPLVDHTYLLDRFSAGVRYAPSCQLLQLTQDFHRPSFSHLIGIQNPTNDLSFSDLEMDCIRSMFQPHETILPKAEATKTAFSTQDLQSTHCVHFACHGVFDFDTPLRSALVLAGTSVEEIDLEQCLTLGEIFDLNLQQCRLVTLSACETGLTDIRSLGDEYVGLTSGFLYAGSPNIVSSLWTVNDISTAFLMIRFYQNLFEGEFVAVALNKAQKWLRDVSGPELDDWMIGLESIKYLWIYPKCNLHKE